MHTDDPSPADLRAEVPPVSERFGAFEFGDSLVVYDDDHPDRWLLSTVAYDRDELR